MKGFLKRLLGPVPTPTAPTAAFGPRFASPADACEEALKSLLGRLPDGFIDRAAFGPVWVAGHRAGTSGTRAVEAELIALLPPDDQWPELTPVCDLQAPGPRRLFLQTLDREVHRIARDSRASESAALLPLVVFMTVGDKRTCPEHQAADGQAKRFGRDGTAPVFVDWRWGCRCTTIQMSERTAARRGLSIPA